MGLYDDLQKDVLEAFDGDLFDATRTVQVYTSSSVYDFNTLKNSVTEVATDIRVVKVVDRVGENPDDPTLTDYAEYILMDADRITANITIQVEMKLKDGDDQYKITGIDLDPTGSAWTLMCRRFG